MSDLTTGEKVTAKAAQPSTWAGLSGALGGVVAAIGLYHGTASLFDPAFLGAAAAAVTGLFAFFQKHPQATVSAEAKK